MPATETYPRFHNAAHQDRTDDAAEEEEVVPAAHVNVFFGHRFLARLAGVERLSTKKNITSRGTTRNAMGGNRWSVQKNGTLVQEPQEQGWVAQRCQRTADIAHQEDEEDDDVDLVFPPGVGPQHGRISTIDAPVVPIHDASSVPDARIIEIIPRRP